MKCVLPGRGIRAFGKAVFCLAKLGEELYIEGYKSGLALKTVNNARSAYACFLFDKSFFLSYTPSLADPTDSRATGEAENVVKCKISNKSCMSVFKSLSTLERTVEHCRMKLDEEASKLVFVFHCRHGIIKTHSLGYQECDVVQAMFDKNLCTNQLKISSRILSNVMSNFPNTLEEVTLKAESAGISVRSYVDEHNMEDVRVSLTEVALTPSEFDSYQVSENATLTFCLKELRALLHFTDSLGHPLSLKFETAGRPIIFSVEDGREYEVDVVLATLLHDNEPPQQTSNTTSTAAASTSMATTHSSSQNARHDGRAQPAGSDVSKRTEDDQDISVSAVGQDMEVDEPAVPDRRHEQSNPESSRAPRLTSAAAAPEPQFPSGSQFRRGSSSSTRFPNRPLAGISSKDSRTPSGRHVSSQHGNFAVGPKTGGRDLGSHDTPRSLGGQSKEDETAGMIDALFGEEAGDGPMVGQGESMLLGYNTELHGGPRPVTVTESRLHGALERTGPASLSQFGHGVVEESTPRNTTPSNASPHNATPHNATPSHNLTELDAHTDRLVTLLDPASPPGSPPDSAHDSSFLPGTPPSKKFKPASVIFGMDLFPRRDSDAYILAPDSASDSD